jgi:putative acetyltransferase
MSQTSIIVRAQEPEDLVELTEVWNQPQAVWGTLQLPYTSLAARRARQDVRPRGAHDVTLVAVVEGKVVASLFLARFDGRRAHAGTFGMAVADDYVGRGVGTALMQAMIDQADRWLGLTRIELTVWTDNARAITLYERFGFEREGVLRAYALRDGVLVDALAMARLRPPASPAQR